VATYDLGDGVNLRHIVKDRDGALTDASVALGIVKPDGTTAPVAVTRTSLGVYDANTYVTDQVGPYSAVWTVSGAVTDVSYDSFFVATTAPQGYTTIDLVKESLSKETDDTRDDLIEMAIAAASRKIDQVTGRRFYADRTASTRTFPVARRTFAGPYGTALLIDDVATSTSLALEAGSMALYSSVATFYPGPDNAVAYGKPITFLQVDPSTLTAASSIRVTARWGWPVVPDEVALAAQLLAARLYRRKDSPQGVISSGDWGSVRVSRVDPDVEALISNFILPGFA
jgi:hypothetical protein